MAEHEVFWMEDLRHDLERLGQARTRPVEVLVGLGQINTAGGRSGEGVPARLKSQEADLPLDALEREAAQGNTRRTTDAPHWGGLGGSTLSEATSWGKVSKKATHEMAFIETSVALPLLYGYALQKDSAKGRKRMKYEWHGDIFEERPPRRGSGRQILRVFSVCWRYPRKAHGRRQGPTR